MWVLVSGSHYSAYDCERIQQKGELERLVFDEIPHGSVGNDGDEKHAGGADARFGVLMPHLLALQYRVNCLNARHLRLCPSAIG